MTIPSKEEIVSLVEAQAESIDSISKRLLKIEQLVNTQESRNRDIIIAVVIAALLIVVTVAAQVSISDKRDGDRADNLLENVKTAQLDVSDLRRELEVGLVNIKSEIDLLRARNSYLK